MQIFKRLISTERKEIKASVFKHFHTKRLVCLFSWDSQHNAVWAWTATEHLKEAEFQELHIHTMNVDILILEILV
jgi:hypothetical protein